MNIKWMILCGVGILCLANFSIWQKEQHIDEGKPLFLELAPKDPRSLMQGDYMNLNFAVARAVQNQLEPSLSDQEGWVILDVDSEQRGHFKHIVKPSTSEASTSEAGTLETSTLETSTAKPNQLAIQYKVRNYQLVLTPNAYFFEEGLAKRFDAARYGEFRVNADGGLLLVGLWDNKLQPIRPRVYDKSSIFLED
jgi:uncharacterized membrane-anchored protein